MCIRDRCRCLIYAYLKDKTSLVIVGAFYAAIQFCFIALPVHVYEPLGLSVMLLPSFELPY